MILDKVDLGEDDRKVQLEVEDEIGQSELDRQSPTTESATLTHLVYIHETTFSIKICKLL